jgi:hypothetical protein
MLIIQKWMNWKRCLLNKTMHVFYICVLFIEFMDNLRNNKIEKLICSHLVSTVKPMEIV